jgi:hypothetical protein
MPSMLQLHVTIPVLSAKVNLPRPYDEKDDEQLQTRVGQASGPAFWDVSVDNSYSLLYWFSCFFNSNPGSAQRCHGGLK